MATLVSNAFDLDVQVSAFAAPAGYADWITYWTEMIELTGSLFAAGGTNYQDSEYDQLGPRSVFYGPGESMWRFREHWARIGQSHTNIDAGMNRAIAAYLGKYTRSATVGSRIFTNSEVPYYAYTEGLGGGDITVTLQDIQNEIDNFNFEEFARYRIGPTWEDPTYDFYGRYTARSREVAHFAKSLVYAEKAGHPRHMDRDDTNIPSIQYIYDCMISNIYRWRNEFLNQGSGHTSADSVAPFMIAKTVESIRLWREWLIENGEDPELFFPAQVFTDDYPNGSFIANPYANSLDACEDIMTWLGSPLDGYVLDTTPYPHAAAYARGTVSGNLGQPMTDVLTSTFGDYAWSYQRSNNLSFPGDLNMQNVINFWWLASIRDGVDNVVRDKMISYGDKFFYGGVKRYELNGSGPYQQQKLRNENMETVHEAFDYRNTVTGRSD